MRIIYYLWFFLNTVLSKFNKKLENLIFFYNCDSVYRFNNLNSFQKLFLVYFYNVKSYLRLLLSYKESEKLGLYRLENYRSLHNFMLYNFIKNKSNINSQSLNYREERKTKYSLAKVFLNEIGENDNLNSKDSILLIIVLTKLNKAICNYKQNYFWQTLVSQKASLINIVLTKKLLRHVVSDATFYKYNLTTIRGFFSYFFNLNEPAKKIVSLELDKRKNSFEKSTNNDTDLFKKLIEIHVSKNELILKKYKKFYKSVFVDVEFNVNSNKKIYTYFKNVNAFAIVFKKEFIVFYKDLFFIKHIPTDVSQYFIYKSKVTSLFIRKNKIFNKGRYSRNRQLYRTGVYWCLILNILGVFGLYYYFYRFVFNFGYFWFPLCLLILSIFGSRLVKYRFYNVNNIILEINLFLNLVSSFGESVVINSFKRFKKFTIKMYYLLKFKIKYTIIAVFRKLKSLL